MWTMPIPTGPAPHCLLYTSGADGVTLNYTVAVPLMDQKGQITGCLFCAIYFDEVVDILRQSAGNGGTGITLVGSRGQVMSSTDALPYGESIMNTLRKGVLFGTTADQLEEQLLAASPGAFWSIRDGNLYYTAYQRVENTNWDILCSVDFWSTFEKTVPALVLVAGLTVLGCLCLLWFVRRYIAGQMQIVDMLVHSVEELEKRVYQDERPEDVDFQEVLRLTDVYKRQELRSDIDESIWRQNTIDGKVYTLPFHQLQNTLMVNREMMEAAGLEAYIPKDDAVAVSYTHLDVYKRQG